MLTVWRSRKNTFSPYATHSSKAKQSRFHSHMQRSWQPSMARSRLPTRIFKTIILTRRRWSGFRYVSFSFACSRLLRRIALVLIYLQVLKKTALPPPPPPKQAPVTLQKITGHQPPEHKPVDMEKEKAEMERLKEGGRNEKEKEKEV